ncbi:MAG TPA: ABC transporter ATP-binding protein [Thermomicrobiales bacterium]
MTATALTLTGARTGQSAPVSFEQVTKKYGNVLAVDNLTLSVENGELMVLLGPSGCGKTTSLRMLAGLEKITSGVIRIGDVVVNDLPPRSRNIAMVFQSYALYSHLTVFENLAYPLRVRKLKKDEIKRRVQEVAERVQIADLLDRKPREISGGQRQRVALGRAIIREPSVFLMDEPLSNLDAKLRLHMRGELKRFQRDLATTTIYVTHDQAEAMTLADRVAIMNKGVLQQVGPPREVYRQPVNMFVAGFLGSPPMNFLTLDVQAEEGQLWLTGPNVRYPLPPEQAAAVRQASLARLALGVRPEHITLSHHPDERAIPAEVYLVEDLGNELLVDTRVDGQQAVIRIPAGPAPSIGDRIWLSFSPADLHLFDPTTEARLPSTSPAPRATLS